MQRSSWLHSNLWTTLVAFGLISCGGGGGGSPSPTDSSGATLLSVVATKPGEDDPPIEPNGEISATFNRSVKPETVLEHFFVIDEFTRTAVPGAVSYDDATKTVSFIPELPLNLSGQYLGRLHNAVTDVNGNRLPVRFEWSFTVVDPPIAESIHFAPFDGQTDVHPRASVRVDFPSVMNSTTLTSETFQLLANGVPVPATASYDANSMMNSARLTPTSELALNTEYSVRLASTVATSSGQTLGSDLNWKFTTMTNRLATIQFGTGGENEALAMTKDGSGNLIIAGIDIAFPGAPPPPGSGPQPPPAPTEPLVRAWIRKIDPAGATLWDVAPFPAAELFFWDIAADSKGDLVVVGSATSAVATDPLVGLSDMIVIKVSGTDGSTLWSRQLGTAADEFAGAVTLDATDAVYLTGSTNGAFAQNTAAGEIDIVVAKLDGATGSTSWLKQLGTAGIDVGIAIATDTTGNVFVTGHTSDALDNQVNKGLDDIFLARFAAATGTKTSIRLTGTASVEEGHGLAVTADGVFIAAVAMNPTTGLSDSLVIGFDNVGDKVNWTKSLGLGEMSMAHNLTTDGAGLLYVTGTVDLPGPGADMAMVGGFVTQVAAATGTVNWTSKIAGQNERGVDHEMFGHVAANDIVIDSNNTVRVCGTIHGTGGIDGFISLGGSDAFVVSLSPTSGQRL